MEVVFLSAKKRLSKEITADGTKPYPLIKNFTSSHFDITPDKKGLNKLYKLLTEQAEAGACLHKGGLKQPLQDEPRAFMSDRNATTELLVLDIDGLRTIPGEDLQAMADKIVLQLPEVFHNVSYIAQASASLGIKKGQVSMHLFFLMDMPVHPKTLKDYLRMLNYQSEFLAEQITLSANGQSLSYILDPSVADNSKLIYIAPPKFDGVEDPYPKGRFIKVDRGSPILEISSSLIGVNPEKVHSLGLHIKDNLRKKNNLPKKTGKVSTVNVSGEMQEVLQNPDKMTIQISRVSEPFVNCNVNGGDSGAYYFLLTNPHYMFNFKGEPVWEIEKADPDFYKSIFEIFADKIDADTKKKPLVLRDFYTDTYYNGVFDETKQQFSDEYPLTPTNKSSVNDFLKSHGRPSMDFVPDARVIFDPSSDKGVQLDEVPYYVNLFRRTSYMLQAEKNVKELSYGEAIQIQKVAPNFHKLVMHILGNGKPEFEHFINWLAYIYQNKRKAMTAWIFTGIPGTGKGLFVHKVLKPLFGELQTPMRSLENIEEQFNLYMRTALFLIVDEFRMADSGHVGKMADKLKHQITEPTLTIRAMRTNQIELPSFTNFIFLTNRADAVKIEDSDRRYNVAPRQEQKIEQVHPELLENLSALEKELYIISGVLEKFKVDARMAHTALENDAKKEMKEVSMSILEEFANAIRIRNLEYFTEILDIPLTNTFDAGGISTAQRYVKEWIATMGHETIIPLSHFKVVYDVMTDSRNTLSQRDFSKRMTRLNIKTARKRISKDRSAGIPRGVVLTWKLDNNVRKELISEHFDERDLILLDNGESDTTQSSRPNLNG
ncbi:MAG: putative primase [Prokaryotic dsDNA virus sp.]|nr:MAG: putative primase [Prokaryotic dsDNA virus sp.]|tara:strand:- start:45885 stop:48374 length:2490 start_codon:yes stop_codon:yes gene_type:complete